MKQKTTTTKTTYHRSQAKLTEIASSHDVQLAKGSSSIAKNRVYEYAENTITITTKTTTTTNIEQNKIANVLFLDNSLEENHQTECLVE